MKRVKYLNNRDLLAQIHASKNTFCSYVGDDDAQGLPFAAVVLGAEVSLPAAKDRQLVWAEARRPQRARTRSGGCASTRPRAPCRKILSHCGGGKGHRRLSGQYNRSNIIEIQDH